MNTMPETRIILPATDSDIRDCYSVMRELRPAYAEEQFMAQVRRQMANDRYKLACCQTQTPLGWEVQSVAGFRIGECLAWGRFMYVDDLVTRESARSTGCGGKLLQWLTNYAREQGCGEFHLDSGVHRFGAHRFYLAQRMDITSHHFATKLNPLPAMPQARGGILGA